MSESRTDWNELFDPADPVREARVEFQKAAAENARAVREAFDLAEQADTKGVLEEIIALGEKATGLKRDQLIAMAEPQTGGVVIAVNHRKVARGRLERAGAPELHIRNIADVDPVECDALKFTRDFITGDKSVLVLSGGLGTRKTGSACYALVMRDNGVFVKARHLGKIEIHDPSLLLRLSKARTVVLDELGCETPDNGFWLSVFNDLFDDWYSNCAKVVITCNLSREDFRKRYGERVYDRLKESGEWCDIGGESVRGRQSV